MDTRTRFRLALHDSGIRLGSVIAAEDDDTRPELDISEAATPGRVTLYPRFWVPSTAPTFLLSVDAGVVEAAIRTWAHARLDRYGDVEAPSAATDEEAVSLWEAIAEAALAAADPWSLVPAGEFSADADEDVAASKEVA